MRIRFLLKHSTEIFIISIISYFIFFVETGNHLFEQNIIYTLAEGNQKIDEKAIIDYYHENNIKEIKIKRERGRVHISYNSLKQILPPSDFIGKVKKVKTFPSICANRDIIKLFWYFSLILLIFSLIFIKKEKLKIKYNVNLKDAKLILILIFILFGFSFSYDSIIRIIFKEKAEQWFNVFFDYLGKDIFLGILAVLIAPIAEEFYFYLCMGKLGEKIYPFNLP